MIQYAKSSDGDGERFFKIEGNGDNWEGSPMEWASSDVCVLFGVVSANRS
jgi:hypothetical protein